MKILFAQIQGLPDVGIRAPSFGDIGGAFIIFLFLLLFFGGILAWLTYWLVMRWLYNKKLRIYEKIGGTIQETKQDRAREIRLGRAGDTYFFARRHKKFLPRFTIQTGRRTYLVYIREDGEWINFGIEDIDSVMKRAGAKFLDKEVRYARTQLIKSIEDKYKTISFWDKYGAAIIWTVYILVVGIMTWLLFDKWIELSANLSTAIEQGGETMNAVLDRTEQILARLDNIQSGGSGIQPVS